MKQQCLGPSAAAANTRLFFFFFFLAFLDPCNSSTNGKDDGAGCEPEADPAVVL
jgi:hypothetical protein